MTRLLNRLRWLFRRSRRDDIHDELQFHFDEELEDARDAGLDDVEARRAARLAVGIDLGTTHTALATVPLSGESEAEPTRVVEVPQLVSRGSLEARALLPSFVYFAHESEGALSLPWDAGRSFAVGEYARTRGAEAAPGAAVRRASRARVSEVRASGARDVGVRPGWAADEGAVTRAVAPADGGVVPPGDAGWRRVAWEIRSGLPAAAAGCPHPLLSALPGTPSRRAGTPLGCAKRDTVAQAT